MYDMEIVQLWETRLCTDHGQIFDARLFEGKQKWLDQPTDLEVFMEKMDKNGKRITAKNDDDNKTPLKNLLPRWVNNLLVIISTAVSTILILLVWVLLTKHFKSLLATVMMATLPPPPTSALIHNLGQLELTGITGLKPHQLHHLKTQIVFYPSFGFHMSKLQKITRWWFYSSESHWK